MESIDCPVCGYPHAKPFITTFDRFDPAREEKFNIVECTRCGFKFLNPRPDEHAIAEFYASDGYDPFISLEGRRGLRDRLYAMVRKFNLAWKLRNIRRLAAPGNLLDYGCATGEFMEFMRAAGWQCSGLEVEAQARAYAIQSGFDVAATLRELRPDRKYRIITMWHVLEHVHRLRETVQFFAEALETGGYLIIAVPNIASWDFRKYRQYWIALDAPRHLYHFDRHSIRRLLRPYGFRLRFTLPLLWDSLYNHLMSNSLKGTGIRGVINSGTGVLGTFLRLGLLSKSHASSLVYIFVKE